MLPGSPATPEPWNELDDLLDEEFVHATGHVLIPRVTFIDSGGHHSKEVNAYCRNRQKRGVFSVFGATLERAPIVGKATRNNNAKVIQYPIGSFAAKEALLARLKKIETPGPGYIHLPPSLPDEQLAQLTAEKLVVMGQKRVFKKTRARNEMTDLWVYALAALNKLGPKVMNRLGAIAERLAKTPPPPRTPKSTDGAAAEAPVSVTAEVIMQRRRQRQGGRRRSGLGSDFGRGW
jgi:phage terminase large subunit GpA-like protein